MNTREQDNRKTLRNWNHVLEEENSENGDDLYVKIREKKSKPVIVKVNLNGHSTELEIETGASLTVNNSKTFDIIKSGLEQIQMFESSAKFKTYSGQTTRTQGQAVIPIDYEAQCFKFTIYIIEGNKPNLLRRDCSSKLCLK